MCSEDISPIISPETKPSNSYSNVSSNGSERSNFSRNSKSSTNYSSSSCSSYASINSKLALALSGSFYEDYQKLCRSKNRPPLNFFRLNSIKDNLHLCADKIKLRDWELIIGALKSDRSLGSICVQNRRISTLNGNFEEIDTKEKAQSFDRKPVVLTKFLMLRLMGGLAGCLSGTETLTSLHLEALPLKRDVVNILCRGLEKSKSLNKLALPNCLLGDDACSTLCKTLKHLPNITVLDLTSCSLSHLGVESVVELIKFQQLHRSGECWQQCLRYRTVDADSISGLRRVTLNHNQSIGDEGALKIFDVLIDDNFIKAVDLQNCRLTEHIAPGLMRLFDANKTLIVVDVRLNQISEILLREITSTLLSTREKNSRWRWIQETQLNKVWKSHSRLIRKPSRVTSSTINSILSKSSSDQSFSQSFEETDNGNDNKSLFIDSFCVPSDFGEKASVNSELSLTKLTRTNSCSSRENISESLEENKIEIMEAQSAIAYSNVIKTLKHILNSVASEKSLNSDRTNSPLVNEEELLNRTSNLGCSHCTSKTTQHSDRKSDILCSARNSAPINISGDGDGNRAIEASEKCKSEISRCENTETRPDISVFTLCKIDSRDHQESNRFVEAPPTPEVMNEVPLHSSPPNHQAPSTESPESKNKLNESKQTDSKPHDGFSFVENVLSQEASNESILRAVFLNKRKLQEKLCDTTGNSDSYLNTCDTISSSTDSTQSSLSTNTADTTNSTNSTNTTNSFNSKNSSNSLSSSTTNSSRAALIKLLLKPRSFPSNSRFQDSACKQFLSQYNKDNELLEVIS